MTSNNRISLTFFIIILVFYEVFEVEQMNILGLLETDSSAHESARSHWVWDISIQNK